jgi:hypothetical protein
MTTAKAPKSASEAFSPKRVAYLLDGVTVAFLFLLGFTDLSGAGQECSYCIFGLLSLVLVLCLLSPPAVDRWLPFGIWVLILIGSRF